MFDINRIMDLTQQILDPSKLTTPVAIDSNLLKYIDSLGTTSDPVFLDIEPQDWSRVQCCDTNVEEMIRREGGRIVYGHKIWYNQDLYAENEIHSVWENPDGELVDITFTLDGEKRILFIPDERITSVFRPDSSHKERMVFKKEHQWWLDLFIKQEKMMPVIRSESTVDPSRCPTWKEFKQQSSMP